MMGVQGWDMGYGDGRWGMGDGGGGWEMGAGGGGWAMGDGRWAVGDGRWAVGCARAGWDELKNAGPGQASVKPRETCSAGKGRHTATRPVPRWNCMMQCVWNSSTFRHTMRPAQARAITYKHLTGDVCYFEEMVLVSMPPATPSCVEMFI